ncbi:ABC transporter permease [Pseudomonas cyclaminis]|uniref:ABC transporter permease n=1 Tax=Pseudomonas cyclaminis TaxID=2781239 RepID=UPI00125C5AC0|nr:ABC transporter permease [Pseudomonas cyclaminis]MBE8599654.1 ABC transporter permease [Pseudomonas cyclaminis]VVN52196.1 Teichoic acid translocation permease protein TagG [Pseudomonas fluorescens]
MFSSPWRHRELLVSMVQRDVIGRYRGSIMGLLWSFLNPLFMLLVYTFVFSMMFKLRWPQGSGSRTEFALLVFAGLLVFNVFSECVSRAPGLIISNANYVKKVMFPLEILPWVVLGAVLFHTVASLVIWLVFHLVFFGLPPLTSLLLPLVLLPLVLFTLGISWLLASLGVYLRDVGQMVGVLTTALMFVSAIFYPTSAFPEAYQGLLHLNPLTQVVEQTRDVLFWGIVPDPFTWAYGLLVASTVAWLGFTWFQKTRKGFADVL